MQPAAHHTAPLSIAVVDDDEAVRAAVSFALRAEGYAVEGFGDAPALMAARSLDRFACLVVDLRLRDEDGLALIRRLKAQGVTAPAILVTTGPDLRQRSAAAALGIAIVEKPLMGDALSRQISRSIVRQ